MPKAIENYSIYQKQILLSLSKQLLITVSLAAFNERQTRYELYMIKIMFSGRSNHFFYSSNYLTLREYLVNDKMIKKAIPILLLLIYTCTAFAITIDAHYCCGKFSGLALSGFGSAEHCGCDHGKTTHKGCCTDKVFSAKADSHNAVQQSVAVELFSPDFLPYYPPEDQLVYIFPETINSYYSSSGFIRSHSPSFLSFLCIFRI